MSVTPPEAKLATAGVIDTSGKFAVVNLLPLSLRPKRKSRERHERPSCSKFATGINDTNSHSLPVSLTPAVRLELQIFSQISR